MSINIMMGKKRNQDRTAIDDNLIDKKEEGELIIGEIGSFDNKSERNVVRRDQQANEKTKERDKDRERDKDISYEISHYSKSFKDDKSDRGYAKYRDTNDYPENRNYSYRKDRKAIPQRAHRTNERFFAHSEEFMPSHQRTRTREGSEENIRTQYRSRLHDRPKQNDYENGRERDRELRYKDREREEISNEVRERPREQLQREGKVTYSSNIQRREHFPSSTHRYHERRSEDEDEDEEDSLKMKDRKRANRKNSWERREREEREILCERNDSNTRINRRQPRRLINTQLKKKINFLIVLPKNYFRFIEDHFSFLSKEIKSKVRDLELLQYDYSVPNFQDYIFKIEAPRISSKAQIMRIVCDFLFKQMKQTYKHMTYLKVSILIPSHVVGFVIGIEGKNINSIRDNTGARIDIFQQDIHNRYRQIELAGSPLTISRATEKIYKIVNKYFFFNQTHTGENEEQMMRDAPQEKRRIRLIKRKSNSENRKKRTKDKVEDRPKSKSPNEKKKVNEETNSRHSSLKSRENNPKAIEDPEKFIPPEDIPRPIQHISPIIPQTSIETIIPINKIENEVKQEMDDDIRNIQESFTSTFSGSNNSSQNETISLDVVIPNESLNLLKKFRSNIYIDMENKYHCTISKKIEKISNEDVNIVTFNGTPEENSLALYHLQKSILDLMKKNVKV